MKAPMRRVLPTPVASAKQTEGNSRSKSVAVGNSLRITARAFSRSTSFFGWTISVTRSRISKERRCGGRRLKRPAMALTWRFIDLLFARTFAQFCFFETLLQQVTPDTAKKFSASTTLASRVFSGESGLDIVVGCQPIVQALD